MNLWGIFWLIVLIVACALYFGIAIVVAIKGAGDLGELFGGRKQEPREPADGESGQSAGR